jgi:uncharacterized membrane protein YcaP (DUF421 family)
VIYDGKTIESHMPKEHVSADELQRALREHSINAIDQTALAVLLQIIITARGVRPIQLRSS